MRIPLHFLNEERCIGVKQGGGVVSHLMADLEITCLPKDLPEYIEVDLANIDLGESIHLSELSLPAGVEITAVAHGGDADQAVVSVHAPRGGASDDEDAGEDGEEDGGAAED